MIKPLSKTLLIRPSGLIIGDPEIGLVPSNN